jgi:tetratricopeptide (TPR) repeat protein
MKVCVFIFVFACIGCNSWLSGQESTPQRSPQPLSPSVREHRISVRRLRHKSSNEALSAFQRGRKHAVRGDARRAAAHFERAIALDPEFSDAYNDLGTAYFKMHRFADAVAQYGRALELDPATSYYHSNLALVFEALHQYDRGKAEAQAALALDSTDATAHFILGWELTEQSKELQTAIFHLERAAPKIPEADQLLAIARRKQGALLSSRGGTETPDSSPLAGGRQTRAQRADEIVHVPAADVQGRGNAQNVAVQASAADE